MMPKYPTMPIWVWYAKQPYGWTLTNLTSIPLFRFSMSNQLMEAIMEAAEKGDMTEVMRLQTVKRVNAIPKWRLDQWDISEEDWESSSMSVKLTLIRLMDNCEEAHEMYNNLSEAIESLPIWCL